MLSSLPDLTGTNPAYAVVNDLYTIFTSSQVVEFGTPVYLSSLVVSVGGTVLSQGPDWAFATIDYTAMSRAMNINPSFSSTLVKSITVTSSRTRPYQISCNYQGFFLNTRNTNCLSNTAPKLLPMDPNKTDPGNIVTETYVINTFLNQNLIMPASGSFFADSVTVTIPTNPVITLVSGVDYIVIGCDLPKTRSTSNFSGVYNAILITRPYAGNLIVTYHAYGGVATLSDMTALYQSIQNIIAYLTDNTFMTPSNLGVNPVINDIVSRLTAIDLSLTSSGIPDVATAQSMQIYILGLLASFMATAPQSPSGLSPNTPWNNNGNISFIPPAS